jgi:hypothetical protein
MKTVVFCVVASSRLVDIDWFFRGACRLYCKYPGDGGSEHL